MRHIDGIGNWVLILMAAASLIIMIAAYSADNIVNQTLYTYGLQFSADWALPYWDTTKTVFVMAWLNIIAAISFQVYRTRIVHSEKNKTLSNNLVRSRKQNTQGNAEFGDGNMEICQIETAMTNQKSNARNQKNDRPKRFLEERNARTNQNKRQR